MPLRIGKRDYVKRDFCTRQKKRKKSAGYRAVYVEKNLLSYQGNFLAISQVRSQLVKRSVI